MAAVSIQGISQWFDEGKKEGATHMIVACDTFDWEDYPVFVNSETEAREEVKRLQTGDNMQRVMEVYDLRKGKQDQLNAQRAWNF